MARLGGRATSRFPGEMVQISRWCCCLLVLCSPVHAGLYTPSDQIFVLSPQNVEPVLVNSTAAVLTEFYASWCGHCIAFSPVYRSLARDIREWKPAVALAAVDCAAEENRKLCAGYSIRAYPTVKFFHAYSKADSTGKAFKASSHDVATLRHRVIDKLENHQEPWPPACPPLEPTSQAEIDSFFETNNVQHLALIFEDSKSYVGREVTLDLLQFENVAVRRVLSSEETLVKKLEVTEFPSCYLYSAGGNFSRLRVNMEARVFYSYALQRLPGVVRSGKPPPVNVAVLRNNTEEPWRPFNRSRIYMADLESAMHYSLRVELAAHTLIRGEELSSLRKYISVLAKFFPGRLVLMNLLKSVDTRLQNHTGDEMSYETFREWLDNKDQSLDTALPEGERWVGCQGSVPHLRRYPCGIWTLFHVLTVQAKNTGGTDPQEVLSAMRNYVHSFFGCRDCAEHFQTMATESLSEVNTFSAAVLWLWSRHNRVNNRVAGALSEDPNFPKIQWPSPEMCPGCHSLKENGEHRWVQDQVLPFLLAHFSSSSILTDYLEDESQVLKNQREKHESRQRTLEALKHLERKTREALDSIPNPLPPQPTQQQEEEEEDEEEDEEEEEEAPQETTPLVKVRRRRRASIVGMRMRELPEDIVDLDSFVNQHFRVKALAPNRAKRRSLQRNEDDQEPLFALGLAAFQPVEADFEPDVGRRRKRELTGRFSVREEVERSHGGRWISTISIGFSTVDISLCVILYFLSSMCLLAMFLFFKNRHRLRRVKVSMT